MSAEGDTRRSADGLRYERSNYILSTGTRVYANRGIVGVLEGPEGWELTEGYDGDVQRVREWEPGEGLTDAECRELADMMIRRWTRFRASLKS